MADPKSETKEETQVQEEEKKEFDSDDDSDYSDDSEDDYDYEDEELTQEQIEKLKAQKEEVEEEEEADKKFDEEQVAEEELWNFPPDNEHWTEEDLGEHWEDYWGDTRAVGWDPNFVSAPSWEKYEKLWAEGKPGPPGTPYYVPYRKFYPPIPDNHFDIQTPEEVVEELERTEEFLVWRSYLFKDGSSYEGTVWDDLAQGKGVYVTAFELCRYEGEWHQNMMQGHGVLECDLPVDEPIPDTEEAVKAREEGQILRSDYMDPFDREWLKMDAEEMFKAHGRVKPSWDEQEGWIEQFGELPEKGHYKYSGQFKHSRFHGCGVYEINGRILWGKFYFGELLPDPEECNEDMAGLHASLAQIAAAKARMFANKPDGMVRQVKGPFTDPSHPYMYEEEDLWMVPGFLNAYYEVPEEWKLYVEDLDKEREMWLNSFYKAPFVTPMPPELSYLWSQDEEFVLLGNSVSAMGELNPENVERASEDLQGEVLLHVPTGRIINWAHDSQGRLRFFFQPITEGGEVVPELAIPIPLGFDDYFEDEKDVKAKAGSKKNIFQTFKDAWDKTREEYAKDREKRKDELEKKWKQEDQVAEFRLKMRRAEQKLVFQIEREKLRAQKKSFSSMEEAADEADEPSQEQPEDEEASLKSPEVDAEESKDNKERLSQEDQQDDEDEKQPRSFGKVAMVGIDNELVGFSDKKCKPEERGSIFPTAFASLSLTPKVVVGEMLKSKVGRVVADLFSGPHHKLDQSNSGIQALTVGQEKTSTLHLKPSCFLKGVGLRTTTPTRNLAIGTISHSNACRQSHSIGGIGCGRYLRRDRRTSRYPSNAGIMWAKPEFEFLSLAVPIEQ